MPRLWSVDIWRGNPTRISRCNSMYQPKQASSANHHGHSCHQNYRARQSRATATAVSLAMSSSGHGHGFTWTLRYYLPPVDCNLKSKMRLTSYTTVGHAVFFLTKRETIDRTMAARMSGHHGTRTILWLMMSAVTSALAYGINNYDHHSHSPMMATTTTTAVSSRLTSSSSPLSLTMTQRDPMRMPSQTPMVPYKVRSWILFTLWRAATSLSLSHECVFHSGSGSLFPSPHTFTYTLVPTG
jgi:hypothetical protein